MQSIVKPNNSKIRTTAIQFCWRPKVILHMGYQNSIHASQMVQKTNNKGNLNYGKDTLTKDIIWQTKTKNWAVVASLLHYMKESTHHPSGQYGKKKSFSLGWTSGAPIIMWQPSWILRASTIRLKAPPTLKWAYGRLQYISMHSHMFPHSSTNSTVVLLLSSAISHNLGYNRFWKKETLKIISNNFKQSITSSVTNQVKLRFSELTIEP